MLLMLAECDNIIMDIETYPMPEEHVLYKNLSTFILGGECNSINILSSAIGHDTG